MNVQKKTEKRFITLKEVNRRLSPFRLTQANIAKMRLKDVVMVHEPAEGKYYFDWHVIRDEFCIKANELNA